MRPVFLTYCLAVACVLAALPAAAQNLTRVRAYQEILERGVSDTTAARLGLEIADEFIFNDPDTARHFSQLALTRAMAAGDTARMARAMNYLGICHYSQGHYLSALENYQQSLAWYKAADDPVGEMKVVNNIGIVYTNLGEYRQAIATYEEALERNTALDNPQNAAYNLFNIINGHLMLGEVDKAREKLGLLRAIHRKYPDAPDPSSIEAELYLREHKPDSALMSIERALKVSRAEGDEYFVASTLISKATALQMKRAYPEAEAQLGEAERLIRKNDFNDLLEDLLEARAEGYAGQGLHARAYAVQKQFMALKDSLDRLNNINRVSELNAKYEAEKKETQIIRQQQQLQSQDSQFRLVLIAALAILVVAGLTALNLVRKRRLNQLLKAQNNEIKLQRHKILSSIDYARRIQRSILPPADGLAKWFEEHFLYFRPKDIVSGDFYWYRFIDGKLFLATVDCTGHGVPGAFMSLIANSKLNTIVLERGLRDPGEILYAIHGEIRSLLHQGDHPSNAQDGMDMSFCIIDTAERTIRFSGANNAICLFSGGQLREVKATPYSIGGGAFHQRINGHNPFETQVLHYTSGDLLFMFTDGLHDQLGGADRKKLNKARFRELLNGMVIQPMHAAHSECDAYLEQWRQGQPQTDDILLLGARLK